MGKDKTNPTWGESMSLVEEFYNVDVPSPPLEVLIVNFTDTRNKNGPKHMLIKNTGTGTVIMRYYYADRGLVFPVQKSVDTDIENIVAPGASVHIILEGSQHVEMIKLTAILSAVGDPGIISGKLIAPAPIGSTDTG